MIVSWRALRRNEPGRWQFGSLVTVVLLLCTLLSSSGIAQESIRVGVYDNPPKVEIDDAGIISGLFPGLIEHIAAQENWVLQYVPGTWIESMDRLDRGEIDLMVDVAYTKPRQALYAFNEETILANWGTVYTGQGVSVLSLTDLEGLRVAVMRESTHTVDPGGIKDLVERFVIRCTFLELDNYSEVFHALASGDADAGVVNRIFGLTFEAEFDVGRTPIVFNPIELRFALPISGPLSSQLITQIDKHLAELKDDPSSIYYQLLEENLFEIPNRETILRWPTWLVPALWSAGTLIVGLLMAVLIVRREVRERIKAEEANRQSEERFELAMQGANDGLWDWNLVTDEVYFSPRWAFMLGYKANTLEPTIDTFRNLVHPDDRSRVTETISDYLNGRTTRYGIDFRMLHRDGIYIDVLSRAFLVKNNDGNPIRLVGTHVDISERKYAEESLREREAYLRTIIEHIPVDFFSIDRDLVYTMQSPTSKMAIGDVVGQRADEINVAGDLRQAWLDELHQVFDGEIVQQEHDVRTTTGEVRTYLSNVAPVYVEGDIIAVIGTSLDISAQKRAAMELQDAKERAEDADRLKSAFLATMSHELRTPLNSIIGFTGILLQSLAGPINEEQTKQLGMVQTSARHLLDLINDVLDISKIEAGQLEVVSEPFNLADLIRDLVSSTNPLAEAKGLNLTVDIDLTIEEIRSDRRRVGQIITNLLANAIKFTESGSVRVLCTDDGKDVILSVQDTGIGISEEDQAKLFVPFLQVDTGLTRKYEGTGLGLSICKRLGEKLGGTIVVKSEPDNGSTFTVRLPKDKR
jgi:PAS domain S-box-containing protein